MLKNPVVLSDSSGTAEDCEQEEDREEREKEKETLLCESPPPLPLFFTAERD